MTSAYCASGIFCGWRETDSRETSSEKQVATGIPFCTSTSSNSFVQLYFENLRVDVSFTERFIGFVLSTIFNAILSLVVHANANVFFNEILCFIIINKVSWKVSFIFLWLDNSVSRASPQNVLLANIVSYGISLQMLSI